MHAAVESRGSCREVSGSYSGGHMWFTLLSRNTDRESEDRWSVEQKNAELCAAFKGFQEYGVVSLSWFRPLQYQMLFHCVTVWSCKGGAGVTRGDKLNSECKSEDILHFIWDVLTTFTSSVLNFEDLVIFIKVFKLNSFVLLSLKYPKHHTGS